MDALTIMRSIEALITNKAKDLATEDTIKEFKGISTETILKAVVLEQPIIEENRIFARDSVKEYYDNKLQKYRAKIETNLYLKLEKLIESILV